MTAVPFRKMHGLGNDFVVLDARHQSIALTADRIRAIGDRRRGVGFDQLLVIEPSNAGDFFMRIFNPDGSEARACGNGTRCVAHLLMVETGTQRVVIETVAGLLECVAAEDGTVSVDMGLARTDWQAIPLAEETDTLSVDLPGAPLNGACCVNIGNPHAVFFVDDPERVRVEEIGPMIETHRLFPERANIEFVKVLDRGRMRMRVWERGAGVTQACGSGACAALVAAARWGFSDRTSDVILDGGVLTITWREDDHVIMSGPVSTSFEGELDLDTVLTSAAGGLAA